MRRAIARVLSVVIVVGLVSVLVKMTFDRKDVATDVATTTKIADLHIALPHNMRNFPVELLPLP
jgi:hypothetical protein